MGTLVYDQVSREELLCRLNYSSVEPRPFARSVQHVDWCQRVGCYIWLGCLDQEFLHAIDASLYQLFDCNFFFEHKAVLEAMPEYIVIQAKVGLAMPKYMVIQAKVRLANFVSILESPRRGRCNKLLSEAFIEQLLCMFLRKGTWLVHSLANKVGMFLPFPRCLEDEVPSLFLPPVF